MFDTLVVNASPLIFLGNANQLDLLRAVGAMRIMVPNEVFEEVTSASRVDAATRRIVGLDWIERVSGPTIPSVVSEWDLGSGESAVVSTAMETKGSTVVLDDLAGRRCALSLGIPVVGTLGIVVAAYRKGKVTNPRELIFELRAGGMWLSDSVLERVFRTAGI